MSNVAWASTYVFRVASKDMTYAKQLRDYENAVLQKRLEELNDDEIDALMAEVLLDLLKGKIIFVIFVHISYFKIHTSYSYIHSYTFTFISYTIAPFINID